MLNAITGYSHEMMPLEKDGSSGKRFILFNPFTATSYNYSVWLCSEQYHVSAENRIAHIVHCQNKCLIFS
jgi:hypothetical protein